jgi:hypothetical protein
VSPDAEPPLEQPVPLARDIHAVRRTDALIDALGGRRSSGSDLRLSHDPALGLLQALLKDVNEPSAARPPAAGGTPGGAPGDGDRPPGPPRGPRRRGSRTIVALGVAGAVLATTGVAAAGPSEPSALEQDAAGPVEDISKRSVTGPTNAGMAVLADGASPARRPPSPIGDRAGKAADAGDARDTEDAGDREAEPRRSPVVRAPLRHGDVPYRPSRTGRVGLSVATSRDGTTPGDDSDCEQDEASRAGDGVQTWGLRFPLTRPWGGNRR